MSTMNLYWKEAPSAPPTSTYLSAVPAAKLQGYRQEGPGFAFNHAEGGKTSAGKSSLFSASS